MKDRHFRFKSRIFITIGLLLISAALFLTLYNVIDERRAQKSVQEVMMALDYNEDISDIQMESDAEINRTVNEMEIPDYVLNPDMDMPEQILNGYAYIGVLEIPAYEMTLPVISSWSYSALKTAPCRYAGSAYTDNLVISAHNYRSHFGCLKHLMAGDEVRFTDLDGNVFQYKVAEKTTLQPDEVEAMVVSEWDLTLFTCTPGGQYRETVRCERLEN